MAKAIENEISGWTGWVVFAALLMMLQGVFQGIEGLVALFNKTLYVTGPDHIWIFDITAWGWIHLIIGVVLLLVSFALLRGSMWGVIGGVVMTILSALANFAFLPVYPLWSTTVLVLDGLILYALVTHGTDLKA